MMNCYAVLNHASTVNRDGGGILNQASQRIYSAFRDFLDTFHCLMI
jgi:hypothetical protein